MFFIDNILKTNQKAKHFNLGQTAFNWKQYLF